MLTGLYNTYQMQLYSALVLIILYSISALTVILLKVMYQNKIKVHSPFLIAISISYLLILVWGNIMNGIVLITKNNVGDTLFLFHSLVCQMRLVKCITRHLHAMALIFLHAF